MRAAEASDKNRSREFKPELISIPMRTRPSSTAAFTLIEIITAISIIVILMALVIQISGYVQQRAFKARAEGEIKGLAMACEAYKADNGGYPMDIVSGGSALGVTDQLSPKENFNPSDPAYDASNLFLYKEITGDKTGAAGGPDGLPDVGEQRYLNGFDGKMLKVDRDANGKITNVRYFQDPWGYPYGYSTAAGHEEMIYQKNLKSSGASATRPTTSRGFNATYDLWSTTGNKVTSAPSSDNDKQLQWAKWEKNWK